MELSWRVWSQEEPTCPVVYPKRRAPIRQLSKDQRQEYVWASGPTRRLPTDFRVRRMDSGLRSQLTA